MFISNERVITAKQRIIRPGIWRLSMASCSLSIRFCTYIIIARALGTQSFGILLFTQGFATLLLPIIGIGITPLASRRIAEIQHTLHSSAGIFHLLWYQQCRRVLLYCFAYVPLAFLLSFLSKGAIPLFLLMIAGLAAILLLLSSVVSITLQGLRHYDLMAGLRFFSTLLNFFLALVVIQGNGELLSMLLLTPTCAGIITLTIALICIVRRLPRRRVAEPGPLLRERIEQSQRPSLLLFVLDSVVWRELLFLVFILTYWHTLSALGFYAFSILLCTRLIEVAPTLFVTYILPLRSRLFPVRHYTSAYDAFVHTSCAIASIAIVICSLVALCCPLVIATCFGTAYLPMVTPLRVLLIAVVFGSIATVSLTHLTQHECQREQIWLGIATAILHSSLAIPCILLWGLLGAAIASTIAHAISTIGSVILCRRLLLHHS